MKLNPGRARLSLLVAILAASGVAAVYPNPFTGAAPVAEPQPAQPPAATTEAAPTGLGFLPALARIQRQLSVELGEVLKAAARGQDRLATVVVLGLAFLYGLVHALLPGHRKVVIMSYFLARDARVWQGVVTGLAMGILHGFSVVGIVGSLYLVAREGLLIGRSTEEARRLLEQGTAYLVIAVGLWLLIGSIRHAVVHHHHSADQEGRPVGKAASFASLVPTLVAAGLVPCPAASLVLMAAISLGAIALGIWAILSLSIGIAVVLVVVSVLTILLKQRILRVFESRLGDMLHHGLDIGASLLFVAFGLIFSR